MNPASKYRHLFAEATWPSGPTRVAFGRCTEPPPDGLISNVTVVPFVGDRYVIIRLASGRWEVPGGTLEPGECYLDAARRELLEEAGARLVNARVIGAWRCHSLAESPYRPHLPHPESYRLALLAEVEIAGPPANPDGGESVSLVECVGVDEAARRLAEAGRDDLADLYRFAAANNGMHPTADTTALM